MTTTRPDQRVVLVVGNGFSIGLTDGIGASGMIDLRVLLPCPPTTSLVVDGAVLGPLWSSDEWDKLMPEWDKWCATDGATLGPRDRYLDFCGALASVSVANPARAHGAITLSTKDPRIQLRYYLWHLFREFDRTVMSLLSQDPLERSPTGAALRGLLHAGSQLDVVSYNYDCWLENCIARLGGRPVVEPDPNVHLDSSADPRVTVIKPHGSISFVAAPALAGGPTPWRHASEMSEIRAEWPRVICKYPLPTHVPYVPELLPPGHPERDLLLPGVSWAADAEKAVEECDAVVLWGLSGSKPDTAEVQRLLQRCDRRIPIVHVGIPLFDLSSPAGVCARACASRYHFVDASDRAQLSQLGLVTRAMLTV